MRFRSDDNVLIIKGRDRGKQGRIQQVYKSSNKVLVEGINIVKKHQKASQGVRQAGIIQKELPIPSANRHESDTSIWPTARRQEYAESAR